MSRFMRKGVVLVDALGPDALRSRNLLLHLRPVPLLVGAFATCESGLQVPTATSSSTRGMA